VSETSGKKSFARVGIKKWGGSWGGQGGGSGGGWTHKKKKKGVRGESVGGAFNGLGGEK